jgi:hypothetical protein
MGAMGTLVVWVLLLAFALLGPRFGADSRVPRDSQLPEHAADRYWWPDG